MKVLLNALGASMGGAHRHLTNFLPALGQCDQRNTYRVLVRSSLSFDTGCLPRNVDLVRVHDTVASNPLCRLFYDITWLPYRMRREGVDIAVSLTNFGPIWAGVPHVLFQRNAIYYSPFSNRRGVGVRLRRALMAESIKRAEVVVTPSAAMADLIRAALPATKDKSFRILYHGLNRASMREKLDSGIECRLKPATLRLLYPTHAAPHKGFEVLFQALAILKAAKVNFVLYSTGDDRDWPQGVAQYRRQLADLALTENVVWLGRVAQGQMGALYRAADLMVYPSLVESFGFSMLEAMSCGLPIVASGTDVNREICEGAALYYEPLNPEAAASMIQHSQHPTVKNLLLKAGVERLRSFDWSWDRYAREFCEILSAVYRMPNRKSLGPNGS